MGRVSDCFTAEARLCFPPSFEWLHKVPVQLLGPEGP